MNDQRPDPEALLRQAQAEQADSHRGRLKIFFGATAGVGKTYAMLKPLMSDCAKDSMSSSGG